MALKLLILLSGTNKIFSHNMNTIREHEFSMADLV